MDKQKRYTSPGIIFLVIIIGLSCSQSEKTKLASAHDGRYRKGIVTLKVKQGVGPFDTQEGEIRLGIPSLDQRLGKFGIFKLEKRFRHRPGLSQTNISDLSRIYIIYFNEDYPVQAEANDFAKDPNIEYAEPIPVHTIE